MLKSRWLAVACLSVLAQTPAHAINAKYAQQLERSGCTQASELQGCDINKTRAENTKAGFVGNAAAKSNSDNSDKDKTPYAGQWKAIGPTGGTVATIRVDAKERVWVNGKKVNAKRSDGALVFRDGAIKYSIQGDRRLKGEDVWASSDAGTTGPIVGE